MDIKQSILTFWADANVRAIVATITLAAILTILAKLKTGEFTLYRVPDFLKDHMIFAGAYIVIRVLAEDAGMGSVSTLAFVGIVAKFSASILDSLTVFGLPIPDSLRDLISKAR